MSQVIIAVVFVESVMYSYILTELLCLQAREIILGCGWCGRQECWGVCVAIVWKLVFERPTKSVTPSCYIQSFWTNFDVSLSLSIRPKVCDIMIKLSELRFHDWREDAPNPWTIWESQPAIFWRTGMNLWPTEWNHEHPSFDDLWRDVELLFDVVVMTFPKSEQFQTWNQQQR